MKSYYNSNSFPHHYWNFNEKLSPNATHDGVWLHVDECSPEEHIDERDNRDVAEDAADRFGVHNDEIDVAKWQLQDVNQAHAAPDRGKLPNLRPRNTLRAPNRYAACITVECVQKFWRSDRVWYVRVRFFKKCSSRNYNVRKRTRMYMTVHIYTLM